MENFTVIADYGDVCGEGPIWDQETSTLFWTDAAGHRFYRYHQPSGKHEIVKQGIDVSSAAVNKAGGFIIANQQGIWLWNGADGLRLIADRVDGNECRMNDGTADPVGRFYTGSTFYKPRNKYELGKLFCVDTDGTVRVVDEGIHMSNGLAFSPDERTLYYTDSATRRIYAYDYDRGTGSIRNRRVLVQVSSSEGLPDGLTVDAEGFLWSAQWYGSCVVRYDTDGKISRRVTTPAKQTSSLTFGGKDLTDIFVTSAAKSETMPLTPKGYDPNSGNIGGQLYHVNLGIQGKADYRANISLEA